MVYGHTRKIRFEDLLTGARKILFRDGYAQYMAATRSKDRARDAYEHVSKRIEPELGGIGRVPVEIKPLHAPRYSYPQLKAFVSDQLVGAT